MLAILATTLLGGIPALQSDLAGEAVIGLTNGRVWRGRLQGIEDGHLHLLRVDSGQEIGLLFRPDEVLQIQLPGQQWRTKIANKLMSSDDKEARSGVDCFHVYWNSRQMFMPWLGIQEWSFFAEHIPLLVERGEYWQALGYARLLERYLPTQQQNLLIPLRYAILESMVYAGLHQEALISARAYLQSHSGFCSHGLPWYIVAKHYYDDGQILPALELLQRPIFLGVGRGIPWMRELLELALHISARSRQRGLHAEIEDLLNHQTLEENENDN
ncbi:MAG: hypothetical protein LR015_07690 [Verrucomicrobia bacterium]|nr:hypothetical protein [Verrucomicrobiota bacterium]